MKLIENKSNNYNSSNNKFQWLIQWHREYLRHKLCQGPLNKMIDNLQSKRRQNNHNQLHKLISNKKQHHLLMEIELNLVTKKQPNLKHRMRRHQLNKMMARLKNKMECERDSLKRDKQCQKFAISS